MVVGYTNFLCALNALENLRREFWCLINFSSQGGLGWRFVASIDILTPSMTKQLPAGIDLGWHDNETMYHRPLLRGLGDKIINPHGQIRSNIVLDV